MIALITGASAGFGRALSIEMVRRGHRVIACARREERLQALQAELGDNLYPLSFDIQNIEAMKNALERLPQTWQDIDILINNAGLALGLDMAQNAHLSDWLQMIDTNVRGLAAITNLILPRMVAKNRGHIINLSSTAANYAYPGSNVYGASKAFIKQFSLNLRADLFGTAVRVTNIEPGMIGGTEFSTVRFHGDQAKAEALYDGVDNISPEEIADIILWCIEQPPHININRLEVMPTAQSFAGLKVYKPNVSCFSTQDDT